MNTYICTRVSRLAFARHKFQEAVNKLVGGGDQEEDGLGEELQEAAENVKAVLSIVSE